MHRTGKALGLLAVSDITYQPFLQLAARHAFWNVEKNQLVALSKLKNVQLPRAATLFQVICKLCESLLPGTTIEDWVKYAKQRVAISEKVDTWNDEIATCDEAQSVLEKSDAQAVATEKTKLSLRRMITKSSQWSSQGHLAKLLKPGPNLTKLRIRLRRLL